MLIEFNEKFTYKVTKACLKNIRHFITMESSYYLTNFI